MKVLPGVDLVASGWLGASISDRHDCHVFLVDDGRDAVLIDAGCGLNRETVLANIDRAGVPRQRISRILLTHGHPDHAAGAAGLAEALGAEIWASPYTAEIVAAGDEQRSGLVDAHRSGLYPPAVRFSPAPVARTLDDESFEAAGGVVDAITTPGHSDGHLCFAMAIAGRQVLFSGDLVFARGRVAILDTSDTDAGRLRRSIEVVAERRPDALLSGHGSLVLNDATEHLQIATAAFAADQLPPGLLP